MRHKSILELTDPRLYVVTCLVLAISRFPRQRRVADAVTRLNSTVELSSVSVVY